MATDRTDMPPRLRRILRPSSRASREVVRILHRLTHDGWHTRRDARGNGWPATFMGCIGNVLERRAARRKLGGHKYLPAHVGKSQRAREERHLRKLMGIL